MAGTINYPDKLGESAGLADPEKESRVVNGADYDYIVSFFSKTMKDPGIAEKFANLIFEISNRTEIPAIQLIETMREKDLISVSASMAYYLNSVRSKTTQVGVKRQVRPNYFAVKNVKL